MSNVDFGLTRAAAAGHTAAATDQLIETAGFLAAGDGGRALYRRAPALVAGVAGFRTLDRYMPDGSVNPADGGWWILAQENRTPQMFGAKADGTTDDRAALQAWIDFGGGHAPAGNYAVGASLTLQGPVHLTVAAGVTFTWLGAAPAPGNPVGVFVVGGSDVSLTSVGTFTVRASTPMVHLFAILATHVVGLTVRGLSCRNCCRIYTRASTDDYASVVIDPLNSAFNGCAQVHLEGGGAVFDTPVGDSYTPAADTFSYTVGWSVQNARFRNVPHGVMWAGGDANPAANGALANPRKCRDGFVSNVTVESSTGTFVWGSMGQDIKVSDCTGDGALDVGFDCEGGVDVVFQRCSGRNAANGVMSAFFFNRRVSFLDCQATQSNGRPIFRLYNVSQSLDNIDVTVRGGKFSAEDGIATLDNNSGGVFRLEVSGALLENVRIQLIANNGNEIRVLNNSLLFTRAAPEALTAISVGGTNTQGQGSALAEVRGNLIRSTVAQPAGSAGVRFMQADFNGGPSNLARDNVILNFAVGFRFDWEGANPGFTTHFLALDNILDAQQPYILTNASGATAASVTWSGNRTPLGATIPA